MILFYDFEVFKRDWLVVIISPSENKYFRFHNDREKFLEFYNEHKKWIWCGYNSRNYDSILVKSLVLDFDLWYINDCIINKGMRSWQIDNRFIYIQLFDYDAMQAMNSLKVLEAYQGNNIKETSVPFNIDRALTAEEIEMTFKYCTNDVEQLIEVFEKTIDEFNSQMDLIRTFDLPLSAISKTKAQLTVEILGCRRREHNDEWNIDIVPTLKLDKYKDALPWFLNPENHNYLKSLKMNVAGVPHQFGWGGLHGAPDEPVHAKGLLLHVDVTSFYPSLMIEYNFLTRNCRNPDKYKDIYNKRVQLKKEGKKKEQAPYKIVLNATYGVCKAPTSKAYDPRQANNVCINGQLLLLDLIEKLEPYCRLIQSNTDGLIIQIEDTDEAFKKIDNVCYEWETRTRMHLGFDVITEIWQGDVNNYIFRYEDGKLERKGAYVKELSELDNDLPIVNESIVKYLTENVPVEKTVNECKELKKFQKIVKISSNYFCGWHNKKHLTEKTFRVFASSWSSDTFIGKCKSAGAKPEKFANTPPQCFVENGDINGVQIPAKLNRLWYINLAKKRLNEKFGCSFEIEKEQLELKFDDKTKKIVRQKVEQDSFDIF